MSAVDADPGYRPYIKRVRAAYAACVILFGWAVAQFYAPAAGFTSLIAIGDAIDNHAVTQLRQVPHFVYENSAGYDGAYYVQLALNPTLQNPELPAAIDNLPYRARRILFCWVAWLAGLGQPEWIVQAHALLNVACWLALAWVLLRWFPATSWGNFFRWFSVMFSHGLCMSVRDSLVDGPGLLLVALALAAWEDGRCWRASALLALAGLGRETGLLAAAGFAPGEARDGAGWRRFVRAAVPAALPLAAWVLYLRWKFGPPSETGFNNFALPFAGFAEKWGASLADIMGHPFSPTAVTTLASVVAMTAQFLFFALRWRPGEVWWRVGAVYALLMVLLATPVWEGYPGAAMRVLLPMTLAFNVLVPRGGRWLAVLIAGNLTVVAAYKEFTPPTPEFFTVTVPRGLKSELKIERMGAWFESESAGGLKWRWSSGQSGLRLHNASGGPLVIACAGRAAAAIDQRQLRISAGKALVWSGEIGAQPTAFQFGLTVPPGETVLSFATDKPGHPVGTDLRQLAFEIFNLEIVVPPAAGQR